MVIFGMGWKSFFQIATLDYLMIVFNEENYVLEWHRGLNITGGNATCWVFFPPVSPAILRDLLAYHTMYEYEWLGRHLQDS